MKRWNKRVKHLALEWLLIAFSVAFLGGGIFFIWAANLQIPDLNTFETRKINQSTKIFDRTGKILLFDIHNNIRRTVVPFVEISRNIKNATVAIEDSQFYQHRGIELKSIFRAVIVNLGSFGYSQGGSTITQQVVKNSILTIDKTISRKFKEWILSVKLERVMDKDAILSLYLNESPYGGNIYGVEEASETFFGKKAGDVTLAEAAYLAALPQAPSYYSPYGNNKSRLDDRKNLVLRRMLEEKFITKEEHDQAVAETVNFLPQSPNNILAPHFVMYIKDYLEKKYGEEVVRDGGLRVTTTLDYTLESKAEEIVKKHALKNDKQFNASNAALVALDPKTGQILAMVGSRDYFDTTIDGNFNVATAHRQPGSSFKPIVYATAFEKGYTPDTVVFDVQTEFSTECNPDGTPIVSGNEKKCYMPENYDGVFRGPVTLKNALAQSINIPAIKTLYLAGIKASLQTAKSLGVDSLSDQNQYGLTLVLGGGEVSLIDMAGAYGVFADGGIKNKTTGILKVENSSGKVLEEYQNIPTQVLSENIALEISDILSDEDARAPEFGSHSALYIPGRDVAVKTGTTNDYRDAWIIGYTPSLVVGAWAGNNDNTPMEKKIAGFIIAPLWNEYISTVLASYPVEYFKEPAPIDQTIKPILRGLWQGNKTYLIDKVSGKLATDYTPQETTEEKVVKQIHSILYWVDKNNPLGPPPINPAGDPQFGLWEYSVQKWAAASGITSETEDVIPTTYDDVHTASSAPILSIQNVQTTPYDKTSTLTAVVNSSGSYPLRKVDFFVNGQYISSATRSPFTFTKNLSALDNLGRENKLEAIGSDTAFNKAKVQADFLVSD